MNKLTLKLKSKGYKLKDALIEIGISLSTYRKWEKEDNANHAMLVNAIDELGVNNER